MSKLACPDAERLAAFAEGRLSAPEIEEVLRHLDECDDCREVVSGTLEVLGEPSRRSKLQRPLVSAIGIAAALVIAILGWVLWRGAPSPVGALVAAAGTTRLTEARPSGGFLWGTLTATRGPAQGPWKVLAEVGKIEEAARDSATPDDMRALATGQLLIGRPADAIRILEPLSARDAPDPSLLVDLSAAYLERARLEERADDLPRALDAAERALAAAPNNAEALFNRALALEKLHLRERAVQAWDAYLAIDGSSGWASEARERRDRLAAPESPSTWDLQPERERLAFDLLPAWGEAHLGRRSDEAQRAVEVEAALDSLERQEADAFDRALAEHWRRTPPGRRSDLARGHLLHRDAFRLYDSNHMDAARPLFAEATRLLASVGSPFRLWSLFYVGLADYYAGRYVPARRTLRAVLAAADAADFKAVGCRAAWIDALIDGMSGKPGAAIPVYQRALERGQAAREGENAASLEALLAEAFDGLGRRREAWSHSERALAHLNLVRMPRRRQNILLIPAIAAEESGLLRTALVFHDALAEEPGSLPMDRAERSIYRARIRLRLGSSDSADALLADAGSELAGIEDSSMRARIEPELRLAEGEVLLRKGDFAAAGETFAVALALYRGVGNAFMTPEAELGLSRAEEGRGDLKAAEAHLVKALQRRQARADTTGETERLATLERSRPLARELVKLRSQRDGPAALLGWDAYQAALVSAEPGRQDSALLESWPDDRVAFVFVSLDDTLLRFVVNGAGVRITQRPQGRETLRRWVRGLRLGLAHDAPPAATEPLARDLFEALLGDEFRRLPDKTTLMLVPDDPLDAIPFAALVDPQSGRPAVERHAQVVSPSLRQGLVPRRDIKGESSLVVGNPSLDPQADAGLRPLEAAEMEAADVAALLGVRPLLGAEATLERLLERAPQASLFHYAGHAVRRRGGAAELVLAPPRPGQPGRLTASDPTWRRAFAGLALAVLAACGSTAGDGVDGEGVFGLTRPFLAAGVPTVVGTLWDVDDRASRTLMVDFHRSLLAGLTPARALQEAQRRAIARGGSAAWAAFEAVGAG